jgi:hypothetical protein
MGSLTSSNNQPSSWVVVSTYLSSIASGGQTRLAGSPHGLSADSPGRGQNRPDPRMLPGTAEQNRLFL